MTDLDDAALWAGAAPALVLPPRKCRRHEWVTVASSRVMEDGCLIATANTACGRCGKPRDAAASTRGRRARQKGNAYERSVAARLGIKRVGQYGGPSDAEGDWLAVQVKVGAAYPERIDGWLRAIPARPDRLRAVVIGDAPGAGHARRELIVLDLAEFAAWYGKEEAK